MSYIYTPPAEIGGVQGGAATLSNSLSQYGADAQQRQAATINAPSGADPQAQAYQQQGLAQLMAQQRGAGPSAAGIGQSAGIDQGVGNAFAAQHGGMVGAGQALGAGANQAVAAGGMGRMAEIQRANAAATAAGNTIAGQGLSQFQNDQNMALRQAQLQQQQMASNNATQIGYQGMAGQTLLNQLQADTSAGVAQVGDASQLQVQNIGNNAALNNQLIGAAANGAGTLAAGYANWQGNQGGGAAPVNAGTGMTDQQENNY